jgi:hypothetical protein
MFSTDSLGAVIASLSVMAGLVPAIHDLVAFLGKKDVDARNKRDKRGHDGGYHHRLSRSRK